MLQKLYKKFGNFRKLFLTLRHRKMTQEIKNVCRTDHCYKRPIYIKLLSVLANAHIPIRGVGIS